MWDTGDEYFPWETWLDNAPNPPESAGVYRGLRAAQAQLLSTLDEIRTAVERGTHDMLAIELPEHRVFVSGCVTPGELPPGPFNAFGDFGEAGLARAAGFDGWTAYCVVPLTERRLDFGADALRSVAATRALMFAEDLALEGPLADAVFTAETPERMAELWLEPLRNVRRLRKRDRVLRALVLFAAQTYGLLDELWSQGDDDAGFDFAETPPVVAQTIGVLDHHEFTQTPFTDVGAAVADLVAEAEYWARQVRLLADERAPEGPHREHGSPPPQSLAVDIIAHFFSRLLVAVADLAGDDLAELSRPERPERSPFGWRRGRLVHPWYERYLAWCAAPAIDLDAARSAVDAIEDAQLREELRRDLEPLSVLGNNEYSRLVTSEQIDNLTVWFTAETWRDGWTLNEPLVREVGRPQKIRAERAALERAVARAQARRDELLQQLIARELACDPQWAREALGRRPSQRRQRELWDRAARGLARYRLRHGVEDERQALGERPRELAADERYEQARSTLERVRHELGLRVREHDITEPDRLPRQYLGLLGAARAARLDAGLATQADRVRDLPDDELRALAREEQDALTRLDRQAAQQAIRLEREHDHQHDQLDRALAVLAEDGKASSQRILTAGRPAELWTATRR